MNIIEQIGEYITLEFTIFALAIGVTLSFLTALGAMRSHKKTEQKPFVSTNSNADIISNLESKIASLESQIQEVENETAQTALHRYNPFRDSGVGGNQSFSLASVNKYGNGFLITHLFSREMSRVSTKQITNWDSDQELSPEEKHVLGQLQ